MTTWTRALAALMLALTVIGGTALAQTETPTETATAEATTEPNVGRQSFTVDLGDFQTPAEITYPPTATGPLPTVVLIPGSGPSDMDATLFSQSDLKTVVSRIFRDIGNDLPQHGYAVVRYNKHYVTSPSEVDYAKFAKLTLPQMRDDAMKVVAAIQANPLVDTKQIYVYGWSEGSTVAAAMVADNPGQFAGLIVQGPVTQPWRELLMAQVTRYGIPYLQSFAPDGKVTSDTLKQAWAGHGGLVAKGIVGRLASSDFVQTGVLNINPAADTNQDGALSLSDEIPAYINAAFDTSFAPGGYFDRYRPDKALPPVTDQASKLNNVPVLVLQGERDANVNPTGALDFAGKLAAAGNHEFHVVLYPTLGHTLGEVPSAIEDAAPPIAPQPLADLVTWLNERTGLVSPEATTTPVP